MFNGFRLVVLIRVALGMLCNKLLIQAVSLYLDVCRVIFIVADYFGIVLQRDSVTR